MNRKYLTIGDIADITDYVSNGSFASLRENVTYKNTPDYAVLVRLADYSNGFDKTKFVYIDKHSYDFLAKSKLFGGEIIMSNVGSLGKLFTCPDLGMPMSLAPNSIIIKTPNNRFYYYLFKSNHYQRLIMSISSTTALPKFNKTSFRKLPVPVFTEYEQNRIVTELDLLSGLIEKQQEQLRLLDQFEMSLFYDSFGNPVTKATKWDTRYLSEVTTLITDGSHYSPKDDKMGTIPMLSVKNMAQRGFDYTDCKMISQEEYTKLESAGCKPLLNDVLVAKDGSYFKRIFVHQSEAPQAILSSIAIVRPDQTIVTPEFLCALLSTPDIYNLVEERYLTGTAIKRVILKGLRQLKIIIPPLEIQQAFSKKVWRIAAMRRLIEESLVESQKLFDSRMNFYFGD